MFSIGCQRGPSYLLAVVCGTADVDDSCSGAVFIADMLRRTCAKRVLVDMLGMEHQFGQAGVLEVISTLYACLPPLEKIAVVIAPGASHGLVLEVARHRNVPAQEFANFSEAEDWLRH
jgi:hypothetical protein